MNGKKHLRKKRRQDEKGRAASAALSVPVKITSSRPLKPSGSSRGKALPQTNKLYSSAFAPSRSAHAPSADFEAYRNPARCCDVIRPRPFPQMIDMSMIRPGACH
eukprot:g48428.t1